MTFSYLRDRSAGVQKALWNCQQIKRNDPTQCMKVQVLMTANPVTAAPAPTRGPPDLTGVRRAADDKSVAAPSLSQPPPITIPAKGGAQLGKPQ